MIYALLKTAHILAVVLFLGNIITGVFWKAHGDRSRDPRIMAHTLEGIIASDRLFTLPGVLLIILFGVGAAMQGDLPILGTPWIWQSIILFAVSGVAFMAQLAPLQRRMRDLVRAAADGAPFDQGLYDRLSTRWGLWGTVATIAPLGALALMVLKPAH